MAKIEAKRQERDADALLRTAQSYLQGDREDLAVKTYRELIEQYPKTKAAATAHAALEKLGVEPG